MKITRVLAVSAVVGLLVSSSAFALDSTTQNSVKQDNKTSMMKNFKNFGHKKGFGEQQNFTKGRAFGGFKNQIDSLKMLEARKTQIQTMLENGKITPDKATTELADIDSKIKETQAFNTLTLDQKKEKLTNDFKLNIQKQVTAGKLTQVNADVKVKNYTDQLAKWDGTSMSTLRGSMQIRGTEQNSHKGFRGPENVQKQEPLKMLEARKTQIQTMLQNGKITSDKATTDLADIDSKIKETQAFNALTLDQKKEKLTNDFKSKMEKQVNAGKLTKEKADSTVKSYTDELAKWDGSSNIRVQNEKVGHKKTIQTYNANQQ